jgi:hypothetical protein
MIALFLLGVSLFIFGSIWDHFARDERDRKWAEWQARQKAWRNGDRSRPRPNDWGPD